MTPKKPSVVSLDQLAQTVRAGVVLALEERKAVETNGGALVGTYPIIGPIIFGMFPVEPTLLY